MAQEKPTEAASRASSQKSERAAYAASPADFLAGGGEMGERIRSKDWSQTPLGPAERWPQSLKTIVRIMLTSRQPIWIGWGPELIKMYNDPYKAIVGGKHPDALGQPASVVWREIWDEISPRLQAALQTNEGTYDESLLLIMERYGYQEETYYTFSYSPVPDDQGGVGGIICANTDDTQRIIGERQVKLLRTLAAETADARTIEDACRLSAGSLAKNQYDLPFALLYLLDQDQQRVSLAGTAGISKGHQAVPETAALNNADGLWPFQEVIRTGKQCVIADLDKRVEQLPTGAWKRPPHHAVALPIASAGQKGKAGVLIVGLNPFRLFDEEYRGFLQQVAGQIAASLASAHAYEEERRRAEALAELDRAKTLFFSNVSHEFRTPLTLMLGPLEDLLGGNSLAPEQHAQLALMHRNGLRLLKLVNTLLDFSRIEAGRTQAVYTPTDLAAYTADLASVFRSVIEKAGMRLIIECPPLPEPVYVDREMWEKIVLNLLSNAFKFTFTGEISVTLRQVDRQVHLAIRDTGTGIPAEELPRLFERFHRVQGARSRTHEGSGIGLALVQELVHLQGGAISVKSQVDTGTAFTITLPLGRAHLPAERIQASRTRASTALGAAPFVEEAQRWLPEDALAGSSTSDWLAQESPSSPPFRLKESHERPKRILLADDNADLRDYLRRLLRAHYEVEAVADGAAALRAVHSSPPDLVLSDVMMPELDGFGLLRELRANPRTRAIPVILLSARAGEEAMIEGLEAGADDYLIKPFSAREMLARVEGCLKMARLRQEAEARASELEAVFEAMTDGIDMVDAEGRIRQMNQAGYQLLGLGSQAEERAYFSNTPGGRSQMLSMRNEQGRILPPERTPAARVVRGETLAGQSTMDVQVRTLDGRERKWEFSGAPTRDAAGSIVGGVVVFRDVTERRALERRTAESLAALLEMAQTLMQGVGDDKQEAGEETPILARLLRLVQRTMGSQYTAATLVTPETGEFQPLMVVGVSPEAEERWWRNLSGGKVTDFVSPEMAERLYAGEVLTFDLVGQPPIPSQDYFGIQQALSAAVWVNPQQLCMIGVEIRNRPAFTQAEKDLVQAAARLVALVLERDQLLHEQTAARARVLALEETSRLMNDFLGIASHELRTPLTSITANVQMAERHLRRWATRDAAEQPSQDGAGLPRTHELIARTARQVARMNRLVGDLLDVSRITTGKLELQLERCDLAEVIRDAVEAQRAAWSARRVLLELPDAGETPVLGDADRLGQVVTNYLTNALKYSAEDQPVSVLLRCQDGWARVEVRDQGPGIASEQQTHLWERFYRVPGITERSGSGVGLGLGLYICQTIISRHGGQVGVDSIVGEGSAFWFRLPLVP